MDNPQKLANIGRYKKNIAITFEIATFMNETKKCFAMTNNP